MPRLDDALQTLRTLDGVATGSRPGRQPDPRAALLTCLMFIVTVLSFGRLEVAALLPLALYPTLRAAQAGVPARLVGQTLLLASPFALMVGAFNPWFESQALLSLGGLTLSAGWVSLLAIALRAALTVSATVVLAGGSGLQALFGAMARLGAPRVLVVQLMFLYRYVFVLAGEAACMATARQLRAGNGRAMALQTWASLLGHLLLRAFERAQRIHQAMLARGFTGELPLAKPLRWQAADTLHLLGWGAFFVLVRLVNLPQALGQALLRITTVGAAA